MIAAVAAEWRKLTTTRTFYLLLTAAAAVVALGAFSTTSATTPSPWNMTDPLHHQTAWLLGTINGGLFALIIGARTFTDEFRHGTIVNTYIADPARRRSTVAKAGTAALAGLLTGLAVATSIVVVALAMAALSGGTVALHTTDAPAALGLMAAMALWGIIGAGLGAIVRNQVAVVAGGLLWVLMFENLAAGLLADGGRWLPGQAVHAMAQTTEAIDTLALPGAAALMVAYAALFLLAALAVMRARDIT